MNATVFGTRESLGPYGFPRMVEVVPEGKLGAAEVEHFEVSESAARFTALKGGRNYVQDGRYAKLRVGGELVMSDTRYERLSNSAVVYAAHGQALIAGLGLGMILHAILAKEAVEHVTVVEQSQDVIDLIGPTLAQHAGRLTVTQGDIFEWRPERGTKYDCIYFDIWAEISTDALPEMAKLHQAFKGFKAPGAWMQSWERESLKADKRREERERRPFAGYRW
jgi:spermidine synthase